MGKHYVPKFYLKGFTESYDSPYIWTYEQDQNEPFRTNINNIAQENEMYSDELEKFLAHEVEEPAKPIIEKIRCFHNINRPEKAVMAEYMEIFLKRVPRSREHARKWFEEHSDDIYERKDRELERLSKKHHDKREVIEKYRVELKQIQADNKIKPEEIWDEMLLYEKAELISQVLFDMTWQFLIFDKWPVFVTSDNPVFFFKSIGIGNEYSEVSFPISKNVVLWATWRTDINEGYFKTKEQFVHKINRRTISFATRYIYFSSNEKWLSKLANKKKPELNPLM